MGTYRTPKSRPATQKQYFDGSLFVIQQTGIKKVLCSFQVAALVYEGCGCLLIGLAVMGESFEAGDRQVLLNPWGFVIEDVRRTLGFIVAQDVGASLVVAHYGLKISPKKILPDAYLAPQVRIHSPARLLGLARMQITA